MGSLSTNTTSDSSHFTHTQYKMLHLCVLIVLFIQGLETNPLTKAAQEGVNLYGETETFASNIHISKEKVTTSTPATMLTESNITVLDTNISDTNISTPALLCIETNTSALYTNLIKTNKSVLSAKKK